MIKPRIFSLPGDQEWMKHVDPNEPPVGPPTEEDYRQMTKRHSFEPATGEEEWIKGLLERSTVLGPGHEPIGSPKITTEGIKTD